MHYFFITFLILYIYFVRLALPQFNSALSPLISFWVIKSTIIQTSKLYDALSFPFDLMKKTDGLDVGGSLQITQLLIEVRQMFIGRNTRRFVPNDIACISESTWNGPTQLWTISLREYLKSIFSKQVAGNIFCWLLVQLHCTIRWRRERLAELCQMINWIFSSST